MYKVSIHTVIHTVIHMLRMQRSIVEEAVGWKGRSLVGKVWDVLYFMCTKRSERFIKTLKSSILQCAYQCSLVRPFL